MINFKKNVTSLAAIIMIISSASYAYGSQPIKLSEPQLNKGALLMQALKKRQSGRLFSTKEITLDTLSSLLWAANGINRRSSGKHTAPSALNWQEIDIYIAMKKGLYLYDPKKNTLEPIIPDDIREHVGKQDFTQIAPINLIYVADISRMGGSPEDKILYSAADTGFISQNVYLFCASEGLTTVVIGFVNKPALEKIMKLKKNQKVILAQPVGYPAK